ncbi:amino acid adenylation domain-containing protein [Flavobacterium resistens]|uniref:amino acid adenylation domain-containing protein n=1 Tax=Flavobacterium resistens TaxID=443612 RepID=UPI001FCA725A|nr:non-ribosomal peptide synthetase [Flavobacterium resistens]
MPIGVAGKLYVSGAGVARGYLNKPELTAEKFISNPFIKGTRMYDTGDLGRWLPDGNIEFLGRNDNQVKIRGYRIELGEIETAISEYSEEIQQVVVEAKEINQDKTLVAYYVSKTEIDKSEIRAYLQNKLPEYMVPGFYVEIESLPLTPNGKIDRKALPSVTGEDIIKKEYVAPRNAIEEKMVEIWQEVLGVQKIGITDNFFELGGHSLIVVQVINQISKQLGQTISFKIFFANPTIKELSKELKQSEYLDIPKAAEDESYPLTSSQSRLWILSQLEGGSLAYNMPAAVRFTGTVDFDKFEESFRLLIKRHEILRTYFKTNEQGDIRQYILPIEQVEFRITLEDYRSVENQEETVVYYLEKRNDEPFDLEHGPLVRASLIHLNEQEYVFFLSMHHIIGDGWSMELLISEIVKTYNALMQGEAITLPELRIQYKDYAVWLNTTIQQEKHQVSEQYWLEQFGGELPVLDLPSFKTRPLVQTYNGDSFTHTFSKEFLDKLKTFSKEQEVTLFMTLMAGINVLLYRYTGQDDIIIGTPIAGREHPDLENQIGIYLNTLAIRTQLKEGASFLDLVAIQKETLLGAYEHQGYPFDALVGKLNLNRDVSRSALFDVLVVLQNQGQLNNLNTEELIDFEVSGFNFSRKVSKFDISFAFFEAEGLGLTIEYNTDIYDGYLIERMFSHFENLVRESIEQPETLIQELNYLTQEEKQQLLLDFNDTEVAYPQDKTIVDLFEEQVVKTPNNVAVVFEEKELTYQELNEKANQLMYYLQKQGVGLDSKIVLCFDSFIDLQIVGLLGIIKSGAVYVPIEPDYPQERIQHILDDTKARFVLTSSNHSDIFATTDDNILFLDQLNFNEEIQGNKIRLKQNDICNIIYTSGSTGNPKGVLVSHGNLMDYLFGLSSKIKIEENRSFAMMSTVSTDSGSTVLFGSLIFGKTIHMFSKNSLRDINYIQQYFRDNKIDCIKIVPPYWASLNEHDMMPTPNKMIIFGGEELTNEIVETAIKKDPNVVIINHYGPTEATIGKLLHVVESTQKGRSIPIGRAFSNTQLYILDKNLKICPIGVKGELFIGGDGVAKGYLNNSTLTQEKFVENCIDKNQGKLYKTGDLVVMRPDGNIEFIGRMDNQVKIFGHRIELNEIDRAINQFPLVKASVALVKSNANHHKNIVSYIVTDKTIDKSELRSFLQGKLPPYMIPGFYVEIESIPLTPMGKINRKALPDVTEEDIVRKEYIGPRSKEEKLLVSVWEDVLKRESISIKDNFYNLGGDSIKSIQIVSRLKQRGYTLKIQQILQVPVLEDLTKYLEVNSQIADQSTVSGEVDFTPIQYHFFENPIFKVHHHYNQSVLLKSKEELNQEFLSKSIEFLIKHHDVLRMVYSNSGGNWKQFNQGISTNDVSIMFHDLREEQDELEVMFNLGEKLQSSFNLMEGPLFKVGHFRLKDGDRLALIVHHLVVDGVSWRILLEDLSTLYGQYRFGEKPKLPLKTDSFKLWASLQKEYAYGDKIKLEKTYWEDICNQLIPVFPKDMELSESTIIRKDGSISFILNKSITELLQTQVHGVYNTEINDVLLTGLGLAIKETFGINKSVVKMEGHGREDIIADVDISRTVGWFTSVYPFVLNLADSKPAIANLIGVKEDLRKIPNKGIGYGILKYLSDGFSKGLEPSIEFNYLGDFGNNVTNKSNSLFEYSSESIGLDIDRQNESDVALSVSGILVSGQLRMSINFSKEIYQLNTIQDLVDSYQRNLTNIIEELSIIKENYPTPSDLTFKGLSIEDLFVINRDNTLEDVYKLSPLQQGMYYHWLSEKSSSMYFEQMSYRIKALDLDIQSVHESYDKLISRHSVLRTSFNYDLSDHPLQIVRKVVPSQFSYQAVSQETDVNDYVEEVKLKDREKGFDLETSFSQMRLQVLNIGDDQYEFIWSRHHILTDGWCMSILINDFYQILNSVSQKEPLNLPKPLPYANYIQWLDKVNTNDSMEYWKGYLRNYSQVAEIPFKTLSTENPIYKESKEILKIEGDLYQRLNSICSQIGVTQNTFMQSIWGYLLSRYNSTQDVVFGAVVSGRPGDLDGVENMVGLFINTIPVRVRYNAGDTALDLLTQVHNEAISGNAHHYLNLSEVQSQSELGMNLINHIMVFENYPVQEIIKENVENTQSQKGQELTIESMEVFEQTNYDFSIMVIPTPLSLIVELRYNANKFEPQLIKGIVNHIGNLVEQFSINIDKPLNTLNYLTQGEKQQLLVEFNDTKVDYPKDKTIIDLFEEQVDKTPDNIAVVFEEVQLTYKELNEKANQLAHYLRETYKIQADDLIGMKLERSEQMILAILGILKSGAAYVPIDPSYPQERIAYIEKDSNCKIVIDNQEIKKFSEIRDDYSRENLSSIVCADDLVYIIYTSGSTGTPKGIMMHHKSMSNLVSFHTNVINENFGKVLQFTSISFDVSFQEIFTTLTRGTTIYPISESSKSNPIEIVDFINVNYIDTIFLPTSYFKVLIETKEFNHLIRQNNFLKNIIVAGEQLTLSNDAIKIIKESKIKLHNHYGPAETHVVTTIVLEENYLNNNPSIGKPIDNTQIYILDEGLQPVSIGVTGKLYISGAGVSRGYLNKPELTAEKFISNPFIKGTRMYDTGDLAKWLPDGNIEFLGRNDHQVKIRGYRIELGEIETAISGYSEEIQQIVVEAKEINQDKALVAYYVSKIEIDKSDIRTYLQNKLPQYMVPSFYVEIESLPLTPNGKIDRKALPSVTGEDIIKKEYVAPRNAIEEKMVEIWQEVLGVQKIGITDNFFELGGNSISALRMISKFQLKFGTKLPVTLLFKNPNISLIKQKMDSNNSIPYSNSLLIPINEKGTKTPIFFAPPAGGGNLTYKDLSEAIGDHQPTYGLNVRGLDGELPPHETVEEIAACYIEEIQKVDPHGPYILGGFSSGGRIAFEMAFQLFRKGFEVKKLLLFDSMAPDVDYSTFHPQTYPEWLIRIAEVISELFLLKDKVRLAINELENLNKEEQFSLFYKKLTDLGLDMKKNYLRGYVDVYIKTVTMTYAPPIDEKLNCPIILFKCIKKIDRSNYTIKMKEALANIDEKEIGWQKCTNNVVTVHELECAHNEVMNSPHVKTIAINLVKHLS